MEEESGSKFGKVYKKFHMSRYEGLESSYLIQMLIDYSLNSFDPAVSNHFTSTSGENYI